MFYTWSRAKNWSKPKITKCDQRDRNDQRELEIEYSPENTMRPMWPCCKSGNHINQKYSMWPRWPAWSGNRIFPRKHKMTNVAHMTLWPGNQINQKYTMWPMWPTWPAWPAWSENRIYPKNTMWLTCCNIIFHKRVWPPSPFINLIKKQTFFRRASLSTGRQTEGNR